MSSIMQKNEFTYNDFESMFEIIKTILINDVASIIIEYSTNYTKINTKYCDKYCSCGSDYNAFNIIDGKIYFYDGKKSTLETGEKITTCSAWRGTYWCTNSMCMYNNKIYLSFNPYTTLSKFDNKISGYCNKTADVYGVRGNILGIADNKIFMKHGCEIMVWTLDGIHIKNIILQGDVCENMYFVDTKLHNNNIYEGYVVHTKIGKRVVLLTYSLDGKLEKKCEYGLISHINHSINIHNDHFYLADTYSRSAVKYNLNKIHDDGIKYVWKDSRNLLCMFCDINKIYTIWKCGYDCFMSVYET